MKQKQTCLQQSQAQTMQRLAAAAAASSGNLSNGTFAGSEWRRPRTLAVSALQRVKLWKPLSSGRKNGNAAECTPARAGAAAAAVSGKGMEGRNVRRSVMQEGTEGDTGIETADRVGAAAETGSPGVAVKTEAVGIGIAGGTTTAVIVTVENMIEVIEAAAAIAASVTTGAAAAAGKAAIGGNLAAAADAIQLRRCGKQQTMLTVVGARRRRVQAAMRRAIRRCVTLEQWRRPARGSPLMQVSIKCCCVRQQRSSRCCPMVEG
jgi:hypothetical protein